MLDIITQRLTVAEFLKSIEPKYPEWGTELRAEFPDETLPFIRKGFELTESDLEFPDGAEREEVAKISTLALDRDHEVLLPEGADLRFFFKNPIVPYAHDYFGLPVGKNLWIKVDSKENPTALIAKTKYSSKEANPIGYQVYLLHKEGILTAKSVGFIPIAWKDPSDDDWVDVVNKWRERRSAASGRDRRFKEGDPRRIYTKWMLLEYSPVAVPSNPEALSMAISKGILTADEAVERGLLETSIELDADPPDDPPEPEYLRLHPDEMGVITELRDMLAGMKEEEPDEDAGDDLIDVVIARGVDEDIIEIEEPKDILDIDPADIKTMVVEILAKPDDIEIDPPPAIQIRLERGETL